MEYYVYVYYFDDKPIYVGKGKKRRYLVHLKKCLNENSAQTPFYDKLKKILSEGKEPKIEIVLSGLTEEVALSEERKLQLKFGSKLDGTGSLYNYIECGKKNPILNGDKNPMFGKNIFDVWEEKYGLEISEQKKIEYSKKMSVIVSGRTHSNETKDKMKNKRKEFWQEIDEIDLLNFKYKISQTHTEERRQKMKEILKNRNKKMKGKNHPKSVKCIIEGKIFDSISEVCVYYGFKNHNSVIYRLKSINFSDWNYYNLGS
jgi:hypothetical protein